MYGIITDALPWTAGETAVHSVTARGNFVATGTEDDIAVWYVAS